MVCAMSALVSLPILFLYLSNVRFLENRVILVPEVVGGGFMGGGVEFHGRCHISKIMQQLLWRRTLILRSCVSFIQMCGVIVCWF